MECCSYRSGLTGRFRPGSAAHLSVADHMKKKSNLLTHAMFPNLTCGLHCFPAPKYHNLKVLIIIHTCYHKSSPSIFRIHTPNQNLQIIHRQDDQNQCVRAMSTLIDYKIYYGNVNVNG